MSTTMAFYDETGGPVTISQNDPLPVSLVDALGPRPSQFSVPVVPGTDAASAFSFKAPSFYINTPDNYASQAFEASALPKVGSGVIAGIAVYNSKGSAQFIQIFDSIAAAAEGAIPNFCASVNPSSNISIDFGVYGMGLKKGFFVCNSSTAPTKTIGSADCLFYLRYK